MDIGIMAESYKIVATNCACNLICVIVNHGFFAA